VILPDKVTYDHDVQHRKLGLKRQIPSLLCRRVALPTPFAPLLRTVLSPMSFRLGMGF
jgi:hypothetical protein